MFALCHSANEMMKTNKMGQSRTFFPSLSSFRWIVGHKNIHTSIQLCTTAYSHCWIWDKSQIKIKMAIERTNKCMNFGKKKKKRKKCPTSCHNDDASAHTHAKYSHLNWFKKEERGKKSVWNRKKRWSRQSYRASSTYKIGKCFCRLIF